MFKQIAILRIEKLAGATVEIFSRAGMFSTFYSDPNEATANLEKDGYTEQIVAGGPTGGYYEVWAK